jgi:hypothetical protein
LAVVVFDKQFNHINLNFLAAGGKCVNGFEFHDPLLGTVGPEIQKVGLLQNGQIFAGELIDGDYRLCIRARELILDNVYDLPLGDHLSVRLWSTRDHLAF